MKRKHRPAVGRGVAWRVAPLAAALLLSACVEQPVARYEPSYDNVRLLAPAARHPVALDNFGGGPSRLSIRTHPAISPVGDSFAAYVQDALGRELDKAMLLAPSSPVRVRGTVLATDVNADADLGSTTLEVEFVVSRDGVEKYRRRISEKYQWASSFIGAIAIPRGFETYPKVVEALLRDLYTDPQFINALLG